MGCGTTIIKYLFFAFNLIFWILGIVVLAIGIYSRVENDSWKDLVINAATFTDAANLLIASGVIVAIIGFLGCCGAIKKFQWMLIAYSVLIVLIFILEIAAGIYAYTKKDTIQTTLEKQIKTVVAKSYGKTDTTTNKGLTKAVDWLQKNVKCCGSASPSDWTASYWYKNGVNTTLVPKSCCKTQTDTCGSSKTTIALLISDGVIHNAGCVPEAKKFAKKNIYLVGGVGVAIAIIELLGVVFALCLCKSFKDEEKGTTA